MNQKNSKVGKLNLFLFGNGYYTKNLKNSIVIILFMYNESLVIDYFENIRKMKIKYIEREIAPKPIEGKVISIFGPRRAGKTHLLLNNFLNNIDRSIYLDLESIEFSRIKAEELFKIVALYEARYETKVDTIFLDEIQNLENWDKIVRSFLNRGFYKWFFFKIASKRNCYSVKRENFELFAFTIFI